MTIRHVAIWHVVVVDLPALTARGGAATVPNGVAVEDGHRAIVGEEGILVMSGEDVRYAVAGLSPQGRKSVNLKRRRFGTRPRQRRMGARSCSRE